MFTGSFFAVLLEFLITYLGYVNAVHVHHFRDEYFDFPCKYQCPQQQFHFANLDSQKSKFMVSCIIFIFLTHLLFVYLCMLLLS